MHAKRGSKLADAVTARHQEHVTIDELFLAEDICYNHGPLISPDMMQEFLFPYYQQLIANVKARQIDKARHLYIQIDTDGYAVPTIPLYIEAIGMDVMSPFEVASGCDVVEIGRQYPELVMFGGIDKRVLARAAPPSTRTWSTSCPPCAPAAATSPPATTACPKRCRTRTTSTTGNAVLSWATNRRSPDERWRIMRFLCLTIAQEASARTSSSSTPTSGAETCWATWAIRRRVTPVLDRLVETEAVSFRNAFCQNPVCTPSRCSFMTGWYPHVRGHRTMFHMLHPEPASRCC